ncbi:MAG TPA: hypothetical protein VFB38_27180 [Chthonomonadaceae bacterium]|nr:hypothetical protein [Chthonomonadaceae bacterium]
MAQPARASVGRQAAPSAPLPALALARRIAVLVLPASEGGDPGVQAVLEAARKARRAGRRRAKPGPPEKAQTAPQGSQASGRADKKVPSWKKESREATENVSPISLRAAAALFFADALSDRLRIALKRTVLPETETLSALTALGLSPAEAMRSEGARRLCARLDCGALVVAEVRDCSVQEGRTRDVTLWVAVRALGEVLDRTDESLASGGIALRLIRPPEEFSVGATATAGPRLFRSGYAASIPILIADAAQLAAARAAHTLRTGDIAPFMRAGTRAAILPLPELPSLEKLLFTPQGRQSAPAALPQGRFESALAFAPNLRPLAPQDIVGPQAAQHALQLGRAELAACWAQEGLPDLARIQALGRRLGVDYVLMARVTDIEVDEGPPDPPAAPAYQNASARRQAAPSGLLERQARAEAVGALVRVRDGALLWNDRATATLSARPFLNDKPIQLKTDAEIARDAVRFALIQLQRNFARYRARFQ